MIVISVIFVGILSICVPSPSEDHRISKVNFYTWKLVNQDCQMPQLTSCEDMISEVERNLKLKDRVDAIQLINSSWLREVSGYDYDGKVIVIATIKRQQDILGKKYIFCGVPTNNWGYFYNPLRDINKSFGERFQRAIFDYQCNCD